MLAALIRRWNAGRVRRAAAFDGAWYLARHPDLRQAGVDPAFHYLANGAAEGRDPGPGFSTSGYRLVCDTGGQNPLLHYERKGRAQGLDPLPVFPGTGPLGAVPAPVRAMSGPDPRPVVLFFAHQVQRHVFGAEQSLLHMLERAGAAGLLPEVVLPQVLNPDYLAALRARVRRVHLLPYGWMRGGQSPHPATLAAMTALIRQSGAAEVHQNTAVLDAPLIAARAAGVPAVVHLRELPAEDAELCDRLGLSAADLRGFLLDHATRFVANSEAVARWMDAPPGRMLILPNAVDPALYDLPFAPRDPLRVGLISANTAKKGIADVCEVARIMAGPGGGPGGGDHAVEFMLIGPQSDDLARLAPFPPQVRHGGHAATPLAALAQVDVVLSLSHFAESYGRTVHEAMAAGRPVICYDRGTPPALLAAAGGGPGGGGAGRIVPPGDTAAVARAVAALCGDRAGLQAASAAARAGARAIDARAAAVPDRALYAAAVATGMPPRAPGA